MIPGGPRMPDPATLLVGFLVCCLTLAAIWAFILVAFCL